MTPRVIYETDMPADVDRKIRDSLRVCFPPKETISSKARSWHGSFPAWSVVVEDREKVIAHVGIVDRTIQAGTQSLRVAGIQNVFVLPAGRGKGLCDVVMNAAMVEADKRDFDAGLLFCVPKLEKVYARCGWQSLRKEEIIRVDDGSEKKLPEKNIAMFFPLKVKNFPLGTIHLRGNDW